MNEKCKKSNKIKRSKEQARLIIKAMEQDGKKWGIYLCEYCNTWHVTKARLSVDGIENI